MALASTTFENNALAGGLPNATTFYVAAHSASPSTTGASEITTTRGSATFAVPSSGSTSNVATVTVTTPGSTATTYVGIWSASTAGTYEIGAALASSVTAATITFAVGAISFSAS